VRLVHHGQIPVLVRGVECLPGPVGAQEITADHHMIVLIPGVLRQRRVELAGTQLHEVELEPLSELPDPLRPQVRRGHNQDAVSRPAQDQLLHVQTRHDRLARARVIGQQKPQPRLAQEAVVDRLQLVRQRLDVGHRDAGHLVGEGDIDAASLNAQPELNGVSVIT
jgi:hypothetical protein